MKKKDAYHHGDLRADLIEAVRRLVEEKGPDRFTVADACRLAGVSTAAPYRHFADREEMLLAVVREGIRAQRESMEAALIGREPGSVEAVVAIGRAYVAYATANPGVFRLIFGLSRTHGEHPDLVSEGMRTYGVLLGQMAHRLGRADFDSEVMARSLPLWTFVHGLSFLLIDQKLTAAKLPVDVETVIRDTTRRLLAD